MLKRLLTISFMIVALVGVVRTSQAQYIWMDTNGNGVHDVGDVMNANGTATTVDFWINTAHNKNGTLAICDTGDGNLDTWNSYAIHVNVVNGTATFATFVNQQTLFTT